MVSTITVKANPSISISSTNSNICLSGSSTLSASGASTYAWSPPGGLSSTIGSSVTASPTVSTTYNVIGLGANACAASSSINISVLGPPTVTVAPISTSICMGDSITFDASSSSGVSTFAWVLQGATPASAPSPLVTAKYPNSGSFTVKLHANNSCFSDSSYTKTIVVGCAGMEEIANDHRLQLLYDHESRLLKINAISMGNATVTLISALGATIAEYNPNGSVGIKTVEQNVDALPVGIYFIKWSEQGFSATKKIIIY